MSFFIEFALRVNTTLNYIKITLSYVVAPLCVLLMFTSTYFVVEPILAVIINFILSHAYLINAISIAIGVTLLVIGQKIPNRIFTRAGVASIFGLLLLSGACGYIIFRDHATLSREYLMQLYWNQASFFAFWGLLYCVHYFVSKEDIGPPKKIGAYARDIFEKITASLRVK